MSLITYEIFEGFINIPNLGTPEKQSTITSEIERLEPVFLEQVFGYGFQKEMLDDSSAPRFEKILSGSEFTDTSGKLQSWEGLSNSLAYFVYYFYLKDNLNSLTGVGYSTGKSENSDKVQAVNKPVIVYNKMVEKLDSLKGYLIANEADYVSDGLDFSNYEKINSFGI